MYGNSCLNENCQNDRDTKQEQYGQLNFARAGEGEEEEESEKKRKEKIKLNSS